MVTVREPTRRSSDLVMGTERLVGLLTVIRPTVMFVPKYTEVVASKWVLFPVIATVRFVLPCCAEFGLRVANGALVPDPESATTSGPGLTVLFTVNAPDTGPATVGANCTSTTQLPAGANTAPLSAQVVPLA